MGLLIQLFIAANTAVTPAAIPNKANGFNAPCIVNNAGRTDITPFSIEEKKPLTVSSPSANSLNILEKVFANPDIRIWFVASDFASKSCIFFLYFAIASFKLVSKMLLNSESVIFKLVNKTFLDSAAFSSFILAISSFFCFSVAFSNSLKYAFQLILSTLKFISYSFADILFIV